MTYALALTDTSHLTIDNMIAHIKGLPEMSENTIKILTIVQESLSDPTEQMEFSKKKILQKNESLSKKTEEFRNLQGHRHRDQYLAMGRAVANISCVALTALSIEMIPTLGGACAGAALGSIGYVLSGSYNYYCENPKREVPASVIEFCGGVCSGPYFAVKEALYTVPKRITKTQDEMTSHQNGIISNFNAFVALGQYQDDKNPLRTALNIRISNLSTQINELIDSGIFEAGRSTKGFLKAVQQKNELGGQLRSCQTALMKLDTLIKHIREKILTTGQEEAAAEEEALPADSFTLTYESSFTNNEQIDGIRF